MQMIQDGQYASTPEKPLRMTGLPENCKVCYTSAWYMYNVCTLCCLHKLLYLLCTCDERFCLFITESPGVCSAADGAKRNGGMLIVLEVAVHHQEHFTHIFARTDL